MQALSYLIQNRRAFYTEEYCVLRSSVVRLVRISTNVLNGVKWLVFLACSGNPFHTQMPLGKKEYIYMHLFLRKDKESVFVPMYI